MQVHNSKGGLYQSEGEMPIDYPLFSTRYVLLILTSAESAASMKASMV